MSQFVLDRVDFNKILITGYESNASNHQRVSYQNIDQHTFSRAVKDNYSPNFVVNFGTKPKTPTIMNMKRTKSGVQFSTTTFSITNNDNYQYNYELKDTQSS
eukprot:127080_1